MAERATDPDSLGRAFYAAWFELEEDEFLARMWDSLPDDGNGKGRFRHMAQRMLRLAGLDPRSGP